MKVLSNEAGSRETPVSRQKPLRVLHVHAGNLYGGVETILVTLARLRHLYPIMESHFALCFEGRLSGELQAAGAATHMLGHVRISRPWTMWRAQHRLRELLRRESFDAVICHMPWALVVFGRTVQKQGRRLVLWAHGPHSGVSRLERMARKTKPDLAIATSAYVGASLANLYSGLVNQVVHCPVAAAELADASHARAEARREQQTDDGMVVIIQVSRFEAWKGHRLHLEALSLLKSLNWTCWMVGAPQNAAEERYAQEIRRAVAELGLGGRIRFLGQRSDVARLLAGADIFCQPNQGPEPFGIVFVEALRAGRPVVTTAMGGALEIIDESCGVLTEPDNAENLAAALDGLIRSPELRTRLGQAGPGRAQRLCDPAAQMRVLAEFVGQAEERGVQA